MTELQFLDVCVTEARAVYRVAAANHLEMVTQAEVVGHDNPDGALLHRLANRQLRFALRKFRLALNTYHAALMKSV